MKRYKLIKCYPNSPKLGTVLESDNAFYYSYSNGIISSNTVETNPEFFEEVVEKEYEILSYSSSGEIYKKNTNGTFDREGFATNWSEKSFTCDSRNEFIYSVKRLKDNVVISIGDKLKLEHWKNWCTVLSMKLESNLVVFELQECSETSSAISTYTQLELIKYVEPLFTTEDGYEIRNFSEARDFHWILDDEETTKYLYNNCPLSKAHLDVDTCLGSNANYKLFASEEKAQAYVDKKNEEKLLDSKVLSYNDLVHFYYKSWKGGRFEHELKELVKSKQ